MRIGPMNQTDFAKLKELLESEGFSYEVSLTDAAQRNHDYAFAKGGRTYYGSARYLNIDTSAEAILAIKPELTNMAIQVLPRVFEMEIEGALPTVPAESVRVTEADSMFKMKAALVFFGLAIVVAGLLLILKF